MAKLNFYRAAIAAACFASACAAVTAHAQVPAADARTADRAAVTKVMQSLSKSFEARDAKQLAALWTDEGEYENDRGVSLHGRPALEAGFAALFEKMPEATVKLQSKSLRFLSADAAIEEGGVTIQRGPTEPTTKAEYSALLVRDAGAWRLAQLSDASGDDASLEDLSWLIGEWRSAAGQDAEVTTTYDWNPNKSFIRMTFTRKEAELSLRGDQVIGVDPATGQIRAWTFEADGGIGESYWTRDGEHWTLAASGTLADGRTLVETNVLRRVDADTFTWQSIGRTLDEVQLPDLPPIKVSRIKPQQ